MLCSLRSYTECLSRHENTGVACHLTSATAVYTLTLAPPGCFCHKINSYFPLAVSDKYTFFQTSKETKKESSMHESMHWPSEILSTYTKLTAVTEVNMSDLYIRFSGRHGLLVLHNYDIKNHVKDMQSKYRALLQMSFWRCRLEADLLWLKSLTCSCQKILQLVLWGHLHEGRQLLPLVRLQ